MILINIDCDLKKKLNNNFSNLLNDTFFIIFDRTKHDTHENKKTRTLFAALENTLYSM